MLQHRLSLILALVGTLIMLGARPAQAFQFGGNDSDFSYATLSGINAVAVRMVGFSPNFERYGLDGAALKTQVEQRLQAAGLKVVSPAEAQSMPGAALLEIGLNTVETTYYYYSYSTTLRVRQKIPLAGRQGAFLPVTAWSDGQTGIVLPSNLNTINGYVLNYVDRFISDYRAQNPAADSAPH